MVKTELRWGTSSRECEKGLAESHVTLTSTLIRVPLPTEVERRALTRAEELRTETQLLVTKGVPRPKIELQRACITTVVLFIYFWRGGAGIECLICDLVTTQGGIIMYHRDKTGQR
jgi:hypothetical protein